LPIGSAVALPATFLAPGTYTTVVLILPALGFFTNGMFSGFPIADFQRPVGLHRVGSFGCHRSPDQL